MNLRNFLQAEFPSNGLQKFGRNGMPSSTPCAEEGTERASLTSRESPPDIMGAFHRTVSVGSEALSEVFYSADEEQVKFSVIWNIQT